MGEYYLIAIVSGILSSLSQVLLKKSAERKRETILREYLNLYVIAGYGITMLCMFLMVVAYRGILFKYGAVLESLVYLYIMIWSKVFLKERLTKKKVLGNLIIVAGVIIFSLGK